jgi:CheY-like chemotaxis protein
MKILIAEDVPSLQLIHKVFMERWGYAYDIAATGAEAVEFARSSSGHYDLCIMDVNMPVLDGITATQILRKEIDYFPILGYSSDPAMRGWCMASGMDDFLQKPCHPKRLFEIINELTTKATLVKVEDATISITGVTPMNSDELKELRELKKVGLTKLKLVGLDHTFIVHKNIQNKISYDFVAEGKEISEFIDRSSTEPGRCHLYKTNLYITKDLFLPDELEAAIRKEDEIAVKFIYMTDKSSHDKK